MKHNQEKIKVQEFFFSSIFRTFRKRIYFSNIWFRAKSIFIENSAEIRVLLMKAFWTEMQKFSVFTILLFEKLLIFLSFRMRKLILTHFSDTQLRGRGSYQLYYIRARISGRLERRSESVRLPSPARRNSFLCKAEHVRPVRISKLLQTAHWSEDPRGRQSEPATYSHAFPKLPMRPEIKIWICSDFI